MSLFNFVARSALSPLQSMLNEEIFKVNSKLQNSVDQFFAKGLKSLGLSSSITSQLSARFSDALVKDLADSFFQTATTEINRISRGDIINNVSPRKRADTSYNVEARVKNNVGGLDTQKQLQYPSHLGDYYAVFEFYDYNREAALDQTKLNLKSAVVLPLPRKLEEQVGIGISPASLGAGSALITNLKSAITSGIGGDANTALAFESSRHDLDVEMGLAAVTPAGVAVVALGVVLHGQALRCKPPPELTVNRHRHLVHRTPHLPGKTVEHILAECRDGERTP